MDTDTAPDKAQILIQIQGHLQQLFDVPPEKVTLATHLYTDLQLDSIDAVDLVVQLQRATGRKIKPEDFKSVRTVGDIVDAVHDLLRQPPAA
ncbi:MAG: acyl carrier protein [Puniceicoccales bacterium]|jgi:acyl carrier protein|nr:acyl carrier protein [Puniceicoccales bacterium]